METITRPPTRRSSSTSSASSASSISSSTLSMTWPSHPSLGSTPAQGPSRHRDISPRYSSASPGFREAYCSEPSSYLFDEELLAVLDVGDGAEYHAECALATSAMERTLEEVNMQRRAKQQEMRSKMLTPHTNVLEGSRKAKAKRSHVKARTASGAGKK